MFTTRSKDKYKQTNKTVVTQISHFIVDSVRRVSAGRQTVSARTGEATAAQHDVTIGPDKPYVLKDVHHLLSINCPEEIELEFLEFGEIPEPEIRTEAEFQDASISTDVCEPGQFLYIHVNDEDMHAKLISVTALNLRTGETERVTLASVGRGQYRGYMVTRYAEESGADFDNTMHVIGNDRIEITYEEPYSSDGLSNNVVFCAVIAEQSSKETRLEFAPLVPFGGVVNFNAINHVGGFVTLTNGRTEKSVTQPINQFNPVQLTYEDGPLALSVTDNDVISINYDAADADGNIHVKVDYVRVATDDSIAEVFLPATVEFGQEIEVSFETFSQAAVIEIEATSYNPTRRHIVTCTPTFVGSKTYKGKLKVDANVTLPGSVVSFDFIGMVKNVTILPKIVESVPEGTPDSGVSAPVRMKVNGQFFLNGSFAGTITMRADNVVRCNILKS